jgi:hypothetical protein
MHSAVIKSRDGLDLIVYYALPAGGDSNGDGLPDHPIPAIQHVPCGAEAYSGTAEVLCCRTLIRGSAVQCS